MDWLVDCDFIVNGIMLKSVSHLTAVDDLYLGLRSAGV